MRLSPALRPLPAVLLAAAAVLACGEERTTQTPTFAHEPEAFVFPKIEQAEAAGGVERRVELINRGTGGLVIKNLRLVDRSTAGEYRLSMVTPDGELGGVPARLELPPEDRERVTLVVHYTPADADERTDTAIVRMETNDREKLEVEIPVTAADSGAEILVQPTSIDFEQVEAGGEGVEPLQVTNLGQLPLTVSGMGVNGSPDFGVRLGERELGHDLGGDPLLIGPGETLVVEVTYRPPTLGPDTGELLIRSNDARSPVTTVNLTANGAAPCIQVVPEVLDFGSGLRVQSLDDPTPNRRVMTIESCGTTPLRVEALEIEGGDGAFRLIQDFEPFDLPRAEQDQDFPRRDVEVGFWPLENRAYGGRIKLRSNADREPFVVDLFGRGVDNSCPIPEATEASYHVQPLDIVVLDGSPSSDPGGQVLQWRWTVVSRPDGSTSVPVEDFEDFRLPANGGPPDDDSTPTARFFVDLAGLYELELRVVDNLGQESCEPVATARLTIEAVPEKDLHVQLVWHTPADPDETDTIGTDVDVHLRHQNAADAWNQQAGEWDCYFANKEPDWGVAGDPADNPTLDIDDTNGAGPENINLARPEPGVTYDIGALYFRSESTFGLQDVNPRQEHLSLVSVRVFVRGQLLAEWLDRELTTVRQLWWVAGLRWCEDVARCPEVVDRDRVLEEREYTLP